MEYFCNVVLIEEDREFCLLKDEEYRVFVFYLRSKGFEFDLFFEW